MTIQQNDVYRGVIMCSTEVLLYFRELVREYHRRTDKYNSEVCTGRVHGSVVPRTSEERRLINSHEMEVHGELLARATKEHQLKEKQCDQYWHDAVVEGAFE